MIYVAHHLAGDVAGNCDRAEWFLAQLMAANPDETFILPWVSYVRAGLKLFESPDGEKAFRDRCLRDDIEIARNCNGIVLCGPVVSPGMQLELDACTLVAYSSARPKVHDRYAHVYRCETGKPSKVGKLSTHRVEYDVWKAWLP